MLLPIHRYEFDCFTIYDNLAYFGEVDGYSARDVGLDLANAPIGFLGMVDQHSRRQKRVEITHVVAASGVNCEGARMNEMELNALVGSRICHDLISPLGAIGNGVELLTMSGVGSAPEISLIAESVESANARIRFFRIAYGAAQNDAMIGDAELKSVLADLYRGNRLDVDWRVGEDVSRAEAKLAFLLVQCMESAFPWGGKILVTRTGKSWSLFGRSERCKYDETLWGMAINPSDTADVNAANVHFALIQPTARQIDRRVQTNVAEGSISVTF